MQAMQTEHFYPSLADREDPVTWEEQGATQMWDRAKVRAREILDSYKPDYIDDLTDTRIRNRYNILLD